MYLCERMPGYHATKEARRTDYSKVNLVLILDSLTFSILFSLKVPVGILRAKTDNCGNVIWIATSA